MWWDPVDCLTEDLGPVAPLVDPFLVDLFVLWRDEEFRREPPREEHCSSPEFFECWCCSCFFDWEEVGCTWLLEAAEMGFDI